MEKSRFFRGRGELSGCGVVRWLSLCLLAVGSVLHGAEPDIPAHNVRKIRLIQDDAQDYMVSKMNYLKNQLKDLIFQHLLELQQQLLHLQSQELLDQLYVDYLNSRIY